METNLFKFPCPQPLSPKGKKARNIVLKYAKKFKMSYTGGCTPFYSPEEWKARDESYGLESLLIICHEGGDLESFFSPYEGIDSWRQELDEALAKEGMYTENCTSWYTAVYKI